MHDKDAKYRKLVAGLNRAIGTVEVLMAGHRWDEVWMLAAAVGLSVQLQIEPKRVPSRALKLYRDALLDQYEPFTLAANLLTFAIQVWC